MCWLHASESGRMNWYKKTTPESRQTRTEIGTRSTHSILTKNDRHIALALKNNGIINTLPQTHPHLVVGQWKQKRNNETPHWQRTHTARWADLPFLVLHNKLLRETKTGSQIGRMNERIFSLTADFHPEENDGTEGTAENRFHPSSCALAPSARGFALLAPSAERVREGTDSTHKALNGSVNRCGSRPDIEYGMFEFSGERTPKTKSKTFTI